MLQSDLCDCSDSYIVAKGFITVEGNDNRDISKIDNALIDNAEELDVLTPMYNLIQWS